MFPSTPQKARLSSAGPAGTDLASLYRQRPARVGTLAGLKDVATILRDAAVRWSDDACYRMGASLAYYALFSIFPLLLISVTLLGFFLGNHPENRDAIVASTSTVLSPQFRALLGDTLTSLQSHETARGDGAVVGIVTLIFGASGVFSELQTSLNTIWRVRAAPSSGIRATILLAVRDKGIAFGAVVGAGAILLVSLGVTAILSAVGNTASHFGPLAAAWRGADVIVSLGLATLLFAVIFRLLPQTAVSWRDVFGGALLTAIVFGVAKHLLAWYLSNVGSYAAYGAVGAVLGLLMWIYVVSILLFFGAEFTRVYAERRGSLAK